MSDTCDNCGDPPSQCLCGLAWVLADDDDDGHMSATEEMVLMAKDCISAADFGRVVAIEAQLADAEPTVVDVTTLNVAELATTLEETRQELFGLGEMLDPKTDRGRELHSIRGAVLIELRRRGG